MKIDPSKKYTSDGKPVEHLFRFPEAFPVSYPWLGIVDGLVRSWTDEGIHALTEVHSPLNLIEVPELFTCKIWVDRHGRCGSFEPHVGKDAAAYDRKYPGDAPHQTITVQEIPTPEAP